MSETMNLVCVDCRQSIWIGQRSSGNALPYLYTTVDHLLVLTLFLVAHRDHLLSCILENDAFTREIGGSEVRISLEELSSPQPTSAMELPQPDF